MKPCFCTSILCFILFSAVAQPPIGQWREHLPYNGAINVVQASNKIYCATTQSLLYVDLADNTVHKLSRVTGLSETGVAVMKKNDATNTVLIGYSNSNIDLIQNNKIININDIKRKNIVGDKNIYNIFSKNNLSYFSCGFGIVVIDEIKKETKDTYYIGNNGSSIKVTGLANDNSFFYAATADGLKKAPNSSSNLANYTSWQNISGSNGLSNGAVRDAKYFSNKIIVLKNDSIFQLNGASWSLFYASTNKINNINIAEDKLMIAESITASAGQIIVLNNTGTLNATIKQNSLPEVPQEALKINNTYWIADFFKGLYRVEVNSFTPFAPNAPTGIATGELFFNNNTLYAASGGVNDAWQYTFNGNGLYKLDDNYWSPIWRFNIAAMDTMFDFNTVVANENTIYAGSFGGGLLKIKDNTTVKVYKQNSPLEAAIGDPNNYRIGGLALDAEQNVWVSNYGSSRNLHVLKTNDTWQSFTIPFFLNQNAVAQIVIDDNNQKWILAPKNNGLICFNHGNSIDNFGDDKWRQYKAGNGNGNLPSNDVFCIAKDKEGIIWVGTPNGIALIQCTGEVFTSSGCEAVLPIVQQDQFAGYLFQNEVVQTIAVDGANRKWVGTKNGVWLISSGGEKIMYRFSEDNSPLLSNDIKKIAIKPNTGEVFFATTRGICSFRSTATEATDEHSKVLVFPNPVPATYNGTIAIKGLAANSIVKITELNGRLIYQTKALGGQAIWNGLNYRGQKINSGTYLVLATSENSNDKVAAKIFFIGK
jgi:hypothetical protein